LQAEAESLSYRKETGVMAGIMVSGASRVYAAVYPFVVVTMILAASCITVLIVALLIRTRAFSPAEQLLLRSETAPIDAVPMMP
jgi:putative ABC transport system permease protein